MNAGFQMWMMIRCCPADTNASDLPVLSDAGLDVEPEAGSDSMVWMLVEADASDAGCDRGG